MHQFNQWKVQNQFHPDKASLVTYEKQFLDKKVELDQKRVEIGRRRAIFDQINLQRQHILHLKQLDYNRLTAEHAKLKPLASSSKPHLQVTKPGNAGTSSKQFKKKLKAETKLTDDNKEIVKETKKETLIECETTEIVKDSQDTTNLSKKQIALTELKGKESARKLEDECKEFVESLELDTKADRATMSKDVPWYIQIIRAKKQELQKQREVQEKEAKVKEALKIMQEQKQAAQKQKEAASGGPRVNEPYVETDNNLRKESLQNKFDLFKKRKQEEKADRLNKLKQLRVRDRTRSISSSSSRSRSRSPRLHHRKYHPARRSWSGSRSRSRSRSRSYTPPPRRAMHPGDRYERNRGYPHPRAARPRYDAVEHPSGQQQQGGNTTDILSSSLLEKLSDKERAIIQKAAAEIREYREKGSTSVKSVSPGARALAASAPDPRRESDSRHWDEYYRGGRLPYQLGSTTDTSGRNDDQAHITSSIQVKVFDYSHTTEQEPKMEILFARPQIVDYCHGLEPAVHRSENASMAKSMFFGRCCEIDLAATVDSYNEYTSDDIPPKKMPIEELLKPPGRSKRPSKIVIIMRGPPGSGKTYNAKLIKECEVKQGGSVPRMLCLDDYFIVESEKRVKDSDTGKIHTVKEQVFEYDAGMAEQYRASLVKSFSRTIDDGFFPFILVDACHHLHEHYREVASYARHHGFHVYFAECAEDLQSCLRRNAHGRRPNDIKMVMQQWQRLKPTTDTGDEVVTLDLRNLQQEDAIPEAEMSDAGPDEAGRGGALVQYNVEDVSEEEEEVMEEGGPGPVAPHQGMLPATTSGLGMKKRKKGAAAGAQGPISVPKYSEDDDGDTLQDEDPAATTSAKHSAPNKSKWDHLQEEKLNKLDDFKMRRTAGQAVKMAEYLEMEEDYLTRQQRPCKPGEKRVHWADIEETRQQQRLRDVGFVVGQTDWSRMMDTSHADKALNQVKYI